jgi:lipid-A-disaccharide synthase
MNAAAGMGVNIAFAAGENSGDLLASLVLPALRERVPDARFGGIGGDRMIAAGFDAWWHVRELSVRGYAEVVRHLPRLLWLRRSLIRRVERWPARVFVGVDSPDFNLGVALRLRKAGVRTVHYVSPSIWGWRPERIETLRRAVDHVLLIFPFEKAIYDQAGIRATYVGHPLASAIPAQPDALAARRRLALAAEGTLIAVLPGSRAAEIDALAPPFFEAVALLHRSDPTLRFVIPAADAALRRKLEALLVAANVDRTRVALTEGRSHDALEAADAVLIAGGTAALEAMLFKRPMVVAYRVPWLTERITLRRAIIPYFSLPNILLGRYSVPEFVQEAANGPALARAVLGLLDADAHRSALIAEFTAMHAALRRDTPRLVADAIADTLGQEQG